MTTNLTLEDVKSVALARGIELTDEQAQTVLDKYKEREWSKAEWIVNDILTELGTGSGNSQQP